MGDDVFSNIKNITIVGDGMTGKTSFLYSYIDNEFNFDYVPTM